jgi:hypothetical protein
MKLTQDGYTLGICANPTYKIEYIKSGVSDQIGVIIINVQNSVQENLLCRNVTKTSCQFSLNLRVFCSTRQVGNIKQIVFDLLILRSLLIGSTAGHYTDFDIEMPLKDKCLLIANMIIITRR